ncbi:MAG: SusC/RagA family TonB-linked outer membrane protein [Prolixibacteraceae bacterium]|nr:SusC/RagA family TonB-linked outer membrane protein [Prolixibacteraceae bacterium]
MKELENVRWTTKIKDCSEKPFRIIRLTVILLAVTFFNALGGGTLNANLNHSTETDPTSGVLLNGAAQQGAISGKVADTKGNPIPGATVLVKGTTVGTITDSEGKFKLSLPVGAKSLVISFIGMKTQEVTIGRTSTFNFVMEDETIGIEDVVVVGYGTQKKVTVTGSVASVKGTELIKSPVVNMSTALVGRVSGVTGTQSSGQPGADEAVLRVRGIGTLSSAAASPLVLVDGIERSFSQLDPNEIESISVLKDASSTAVYGIRGANGVIIVSTKKGKEGKPIVSYTGNYSLQTPVRMPKLLNGYDYARLYNEALLNDNPLATNLYTDVELQKFKDHSDPLFYPDTDWLKLFVKKFSGQTAHNLNFSGGSKNVKYFVSLGYLWQDGILNEFIPKSDISNNPSYKRTNFRSNIDVTVTPTTQLNVQLGGYTSVRHSTAFDNVTNVSLFGIITFENPTSSAGIYDGKIMTLDRSGNRSGIVQLASGFVDYRDNNITLNVGLTQKLDMILKGLSVRTKIAYDNFYDLRRGFSVTPTTFTPLKVYPNGVETIVFRQNSELNDVVSGPTVSYERSRQFYTDLALEYSNSFGSHNVGAMVLYNQKKRFYPLRSPSGATYQFPGIPLGYQDLVGRLTYNYQSRYLLEFNLGRNGSENFPKDHRFGWFPAVSGGWVVTGEPFVKKLIGEKVLSYLKLRSSYGVVGNDIMGGTRFMYYPAQYNSGGNGVFGVIPTVLTSYVEGKLGNPDVTWEKKKTLDIAIETRFFNDRLSLMVDRFSERRDNILTSRRTVPSIAAVALADAYNIGIVENKGFEIEAGWNSKIKDFGYYLNGSYSFARNKIIFMDEVRNAQNPNLDITGHSVGSIFGYIFDGFLNTQAEVDAAPNYFGTRPTLGDNKYKDVNKDGVIDTYDQTVIGNPTFPEVTFNLNGGCSYKGFDLSFLLQGNGNVSTVVANYYYQPFLTYGSALELVLDRWYKDSPDNNAHALYPKTSVTYSRSQNYYNSTLNIRDASYIRIKNMELGYTFSKEQMRRFNIGSLRLYVSGQNLITWDKLKILDPEAVTNAGYKYAQMATYNIGCKVQF